MTLSELGWLADARAALAEWSDARRDATPATPEKWKRLSKAEGRLQALANNLSTEGE